MSIIEDIFLFFTLLREIGKICFMINEFMTKLVSELGLPEEMALDRGGKYTFPFAGETFVTIRDVPPGFSLYSMVCKVPERDLETYFQHVLHGNLLGQGTSGAILGLTEDGKNLTLSLDIDYPVPYNEFKDIIEEFLNTVDYWRDETRSIQAGKKIR